MTTLPRFAVDAASLTKVDGVQRTFKRAEQVFGRTPQYHAHRVITTDTLLLDSDDLILADTTSGAIVLTLPDALLNLDREWNVKWYGGTHTLTLTPVGGQLIELGSTFVPDVLGMCICIRAIEPVRGTGAWAVV